MHATRHDLISVLRDCMLNAFTHARQGRFRNNVSRITITDRPKLLHTRRERQYATFYHTDSSQNGASLNFPSTLRPIRRFHAQSHELHNLPIGLAVANFHKRWEVTSRKISRGTPPGRFPSLVGPFWDWKPSVVYSWSYTAVSWSLDPLHAAVESCSRCVTVDAMHGHAALPLQGLITSGFLGVKTPPK